MRLLYRRCRAEKKIRVLVLNIGNATHNFGTRRNISIVCYKLNSVGHIALYPFQNQSTYSIVFKFIKKDGMIDCIKSFQEIKTTTNSPRSMAEENFFEQINLGKRRRVFLSKAERISQGMCKLVK